jgi:CRISPR-associated protein Cas1
MFIENNIAVVCCNNSHIPTSLLMPLTGNTVQAERFKSQIEANELLNKQLWQVVYSMSKIFSN